MGKFFNYLTLFVLKSWLINWHQKRPLLVCSQSLPSHAFMQNKQESVYTPTYAFPAEGFKISADIGRYVLGFESSNTDVSVNIKRIGAFKLSENNNQFRQILWAVPWLHLKSSHGVTICTTSSPKAKRWNRWSMFIFLVYSWIKRWSCARKVDLSSCIWRSKWRRWHRTGRWPRRWRW